MKIKYILIIFFIFFLKPLHSQETVIDCKLIDAVVSKYYFDEQNYINAIPEIINYLDCIKQEYNSLDLSQPRYSTNTYEDYINLEIQLYLQKKRFGLHKLIDSYILTNQLSMADSYIDDLFSIPYLHPWSFWTEYTLQEKKDDELMNHYYDSIKYDFLGDIEKYKGNYSASTDAYIQSVLSAYKNDKYGMSWAFTIALDLNNIAALANDYKKTFNLYNYLENEIINEYKINKSNDYSNVIAYFYESFANIYLISREPKNAIEKINYFLNNYEIENVDKQELLAVEYTLALSHFINLDLNTASKKFRKLKEEYFKINDYENSLGSMILLRSITQALEPEKDLLNLINEECEFVTSYISKKSMQYIDCLKDLSQYNLYSDVYLSKKYILEALAISNELSFDVNNRVSLLAYLAKINLKIGNFKDAKNNFTTAIDLINNQNKNKGAFKYFNDVTLLSLYSEYIDLLYIENDFEKIDEILSYLERTINFKDNLVAGMFYYKKLGFLETTNNYDEFEIYLKKVDSIFGDLLKNDFEYKRLVTTYYFQKYYNDRNEKNYNEVLSKILPIVEEINNKQDSNIDSFYIEAALSTLRMAEGDIEGGFKNIYSFLDNIHNYIKKNYQNYSNSNWNTNNMSDVKLPYILFLADMAIKTNDEISISNDTLYEVIFDIVSFFSESDVNKSITQTNFRMQHQPELKKLIKIKNNIIYKLENNQQAILKNSFFGNSNQIQKDNIVLKKQYENELKNINKKIILNFPKFKELNYYNDYSYNDIQEKLNEGEALINFVFHKDNAFLDFKNSVSVLVIKKDNIVLELYSNFEDIINKGINKGDFFLEETDILEKIDTLRNNIDLSIENKDFKNFDLKTSHEIYKMLFSKIENELTDVDHLYIVQNKHLQKLPLSFLVQTPLKYNNQIDYHQIDWLIKKFHLTYVPSITSLMKIRSNKEISSKKNLLQFVGIGNPILSNREYNVNNIYRGKLANVNELKKMISLPETEIEIATLSALLDNNKNNLYVQSFASEEIVKDIDFNKVDIIAFATHALVSNDLIGQEEPGLVLTPPELATTENDGLLTASEIMLLDLNAQLVILSACNTANASNERVSLSGLTNSFLFAGTKSILVSNWDVESKSALKLTTKMIENYKKFDDIGFSEALRLSMIELMNDKNPLYSHPVFWAPFILVGEGAY